MSRLLYNFIFHNPAKLLTIRALVLAAFMRAMLRFLPVTKFKPYLGAEGEESPLDPLPHKHARRAAKISYRVDRVANRTPWESKCLVRALVAQRLLKSSGIASTLYLGVGKNEEKTMIAHAWIRSGPFFVTGGNGSEYAVVAKFAKYPRSRRTKPSR